MTTTNTDNPARRGRALAEQAEKAAQFTGSSAGPDCSTEQQYRTLVVRRGFGSGKGGSSTADLLDDLGGRLVPDEGLGIVVPVLGPRLDGLDQLGDAREH